MSLQDFLNENRIFTLEGDRGVEALNRVCKEIGYREDGFRYGSCLENFLKDNSGASQAILDWIEKHYSEDFEKYPEDEYDRTVSCKECDHIIDTDLAEQHNGLCLNCEAVQIERDEKNGLYGGKIDIAN